MRVFGLGALVLLVACGADSESPTGATLIDPGGSGGGGLGEPTSFSVRTRVELVDGQAVDDLIGAPLDLVVTPTGVPAVVYGRVDPLNNQKSIRYAERIVEDSWDISTAVIPGQEAPEQLELLSVSAGVWGGTVHMAYLGGDDDGNTLTRFPTDLTLATLGGRNWTETVLVDSSGEAAGTCPNFQNYCNTGNVVGSHAAVATDGQNWAVSYRDTHFGFGSDDLKRSDVEVYRPGGATLADPERGGGAWSNAAILPDGRVAVTYLIDAVLDRPEDVGIWVWVEGGEPVQVSEFTTSSRIGAAVSPEGRLWLAWFSPGQFQDLVVAFADAPYDGWTVETVESSGSVGLHPDLIMGHDGRPRIVYGSCGRTNGCPGRLGSEAEVRWARLDETGQWSTTLIDDRLGRGGVGFYNRAERLSEGRYVVAFQDDINQNVLVAIFEEEN